MEAKAQKQVHTPVLIVSIIFVTVRTVWLQSRIGTRTTLFIKELVLLTKLLAPALTSLHDTYGRKAIRDLYNNIQRVVVSDTLLTAASE